ncbi:hypothetical protein CUZ89_1025 [Enterococcus xinjiangensis]|uniref:Uncharacterized protein n=1 Tax=Enterococcus faecium SD2A-2 TaxID=1244154 RepID=A0AB73AAZ6_ENTFC|nr:hypothetical protein D356_00941 [Enterococcus faecium SD2A-2]KXA05545.1 hypothetical protein HMPREF3199_02672 [Enterococcus faecium]MBL4993285.1 hypothetical protein [Enterococcus lactis]MBL5002844.1 hypothetical protein [Enterococcus lactis]
MRKFERHESEVVTEVVIFKKFRLIFRRSYFWNTSYSKKGR